MSLIFLLFFFSNPTLDYCKVLRCFVISYTYLLVLYGIIVDSRVVLETLTLTPQFVCSLDRVLAYSRRNQLGGVKKGGRERRRRASRLRVRGS